MSKVAVRVPFGDRLRSASENAGATAKAAKKTQQWFVPALLWILLLVALARPLWLEPPITKELPTRDLLLLVDLSGSMQAEDFKNAEGKTVNRLDAVKEVLGEFLGKRDGDRVGLVVFGDAPFLQAPFSTDLDLSRQLLDESAVGMAGAKTAFGDAIGLGVNLFEGSDAPAKTIIALTDGNDTKSQVPPVEAARVAAQRDIRIHAVAIGDPSSVGEEKLDEKTLRNVAKTAGGSYFFAADREALSGIYEELDQLETRQVDVISHRPQRDLYYWPLLAALLISLLEKGIPFLRQSRAAAPLSQGGTVRVHPLTGEIEVVK
ncbi:MAG: VWA domain-containing protein [Verrucomicrobiales bacterium]|nr:VWA domain-containing protein [Verrucomicrobiales bacterium]